VDDLISTPAMEDFRRARKRADLEELVARLTGKPADLLCYLDLHERLEVEEARARALKEIPLDAIVGSVGRCSDFTRSFWPRKAISQHRWARVEMGLIGWPPIEVYQVDQVYFVLDGHHRVSVAQQRGMSHIEGYVTEIRTRVPLSSESQPDNLSVKAGTADFLERTRLDKLGPQADLTTAASLAAQIRFWLRRVMARMTAKIPSAVIPDQLKASRSVPCPARIDNHRI
jgi:hypothetical protein